MDQPRTTTDLMNEAHVRASRYAPLPEWHPVYGGLAGAAAFSVPMIIFATNADVGISVYALMMNVAVGFALPFFWLKRRKDAYYRAWDRELEALGGKRDV